MSLAPARTCSHDPATFLNAFWIQTNANMVNQRQTLPSNTFHTNSSHTQLTILSARWVSLAEGQSWIVRPSCKRTWFWCVTSTPLWWSGWPFTCMHTLLLCWCACPAEFPAFRAVTSWNVWNWNVDFTSSVWSGLQLNDALYKPANGWSNSALLPNRCWSPTLTTLDPEKASRWSIVETNVNVSHLFFCCLCSLHFPCRGFSGVAWRVADEAWLSAYGWCPGPRSTLR